MNGFAISPCPDPLVERIFRERQLPLVGGGTIPLKLNVPREQGDYLYSLVRHYRPALTVEIGLANGLSALFINAAHRDNGPNGRHIAIDPYQTSDWKDVGLGLLSIAGLSERLRFIQLPSHQGLPELEREGVKTEFVFIDGAHLTDFVFADFLVSDRILSVGGLMAFDDADWLAVRPVIRYALTNRHYSVAHAEVVIEPPPGRPSLPARILRGAGNKFPALGRRLRPDFLHTDAELGTQGRCVVLRKLANDDRNSQNRDAHHDF